MLSFDLIIHQARLRAQPDQLSDIGIRGGSIRGLAPRVEGNALTVLDARGNLVTKSFINPPVHLCTVYTLARMDDEAQRAYHRADFAPALDDNRDRIGTIV